MTLIGLIGSLNVTRISGLSPISESLYAGVWRSRRALSCRSPCQS